MHRLQIFLVIAVTTFIALHAYERGHFHATARLLAGLASASAEWQPAAERDATARPEDAFQRAWNASEIRADRGLAKSDPPE